MTPRTRPPARVGLRGGQRSIVTSGSRVTSSSPPSRFDGVVIGAFLPTGGRPPVVIRPLRARSDLRSRSCRARGVAHLRCAAGRPGVVLFASAQDEARVRRPTDIALAIVSLGIVVIVAVRHRHHRRRPRRRAGRAAGDVPGVLRSGVVGAVLDAGRVGTRAVRRGRRPPPARAASRPARRRSPSRWSSPSLLGRARARRSVERRAAVRRRRRSARLPTRRADDGHRGHLDGVASPDAAVPPLRPVAHRAAARSARCSSGPRRPPVASPPSPSACSPRPPSTSSSARRGAVRRPRASGLALEGLGISVDELAPASMHPEGTLQFDATDEDGPLSVKVYGRDAWDGQLLANAWRLAWYRDTQRTVRLSRLELVEHEGFVTLLADRAGVRVPRLVTAGSAGRGDALVVVRPDGVPLRRRGRERPTTRRSTACGTTSPASTTPASPTAASTSTASSPATTGRSGSATCPRRTVAATRPTCCRTGPRS